MKSRRAIKNARDETALFRRRALVGFVLILLGLGGLVGRYVVLQVARHAEFATRSTNNRVKPRAIPPARGLIYDRNGVVLADNVPAFRLEVVPEQVKDMPALRFLDLRAIMFEQDEMDRIQELVPKAKVYFSPPCNCGM